MRRRKLYLIALIALVHHGVFAEETLEVKWYTNNGYETAVKPVQKVFDSSSQQFSLAIADVEGAVKIPKSAATVAIATLELYGTPPTQSIGKVYTRGSVQVRAIVRYFWPMDGSEIFADAGDEPWLEIFVNKAYTSRLPYIDHWTRGWIDEFTITNKDYLLQQLFSRRIVQRVKSKEILVAEIDADLLLQDLSFGSECGIRYRAHVARARPWKDSVVIARTQGLDAHC